MHQKNIDCLAKQIYKFLHGLFPLTVNYIFKVGGNICNLRNFQSLYSTCKKSVRFGTVTITYRGPQIWNLIPDNIKNAFSLENFKREIKKWQARFVHVGFVKRTYKTLVVC